jgi:Fe2+ transport system protein B
MAVRSSWSTSLVPTRWSPRSGEELIAIDALVGLRGGTRPAAVVVCCDATQLPRSTYLVLQCQELGLPCVVALTMVDEGAPAVDTAALATALACPVVGVTARTGLGLDALRRGVNEVVAAPPPSPHLRWTPSPALAARIAEVRAALPPTWPAVDAMALWALTSLDGDDELPDIPPAVRAAVGAPLTPALADEAVLARWAWIDRLVTPLTQAKPARGPGGAAAAPAAPARTPSQERTLRLDRVLLHRVFGFAVFLAVMFVLFMSLFAWSDPAITAIEETFGWVGGHARGVLPAGVVADFIVDGVIGGRRLGAGVPAADPAAVPASRPARGLRLPGARRVPDGPHHADDEPARPRLRADAVGLRVRGAGRDGDPHHGAQARPPADHAGGAAHDLLGAPAGVLAGHRRPHPGHAAARRAC